MQARSRPSSRRLLASLPAGLSAAGSDSPWHDGPGLVARLRPGDALAGAARSERRAAETVAAERARVATEGWGARLLALRGDDGQWAGGACFPAGFRGDFSQGQPWTSTLPTLTLLRDLGVDPAAHRSARRSRWWATAAVGSMPGSRSSTARSSRASTATSSRSAPTSAWMSTARRPAARRAARGRRLELRGRERSVRVVVRDDDQRAGGPARARAGDRRLGRRRRGAPAGRGVPARAPAVPADSTGEVDRPGLAAVLVPDLVALRRPRGLWTTSAPPGSRRTRAWPRRSTLLRSKQQPRWHLAARGHPSRRGAFLDGGRRRAAQSLEHAARAAGAGLVRRRRSLNAAARTGPPASRDAGILAFKSGARFRSRMASTRARFRRRRRRK